MQLVVNIVVLASIYALICCGYVLIYRVSRVVSLAHGDEEIDRTVEAAADFFAA